MNAILTLCLSNLRKRKVQNGLIALLILLSSLLLATSLMIIRNTENLFLKKHQETAGAHQILTMGNELHDPAAVHKWWNEQDGVSASELIPFKNLSGIKIKGEEIPNLYVFMMHTPAAPFKVDQLLTAEGDKHRVPEKGTVWLPTSMASSYDIAIGDSIEFHTGESSITLRVAAVVVDLPYGGPFTTNARIWMNGADYQQQLQSTAGKEKYMLALRFDDYSQSASYWKKFERDLGSPYLESKMEYESIASFYLIMNKIIGFVIMFLGLIMMFVSLFSIGFSISDMILSNYKTIGVLKSLGLTSQGIVTAYCMQYGFLAIVAILPGLVVSCMLSGILIERSLSFLTVGSRVENVQSVTHSVLIGVAILLIVILTAYVYSRKARLVEPVQAIRYGMSEADHSRMTRRLSLSSRILGLNGLSVPVKIGLKNLSKNVKSSILMILLTTFTSAVFVFGYVLLNSIMMMKETAPEWGYDSSNIAVTVYNEDIFSKNDFEKQLQADARIKNYGWIGDLTGVISSEASKTLNLNVSVLEGSYDELGCVTIEGRNPRNKNEIAVGINVARTLKKEVGDTLDVYLKGEKHRLLITGIYQSIANMSNSARITTAVTKVDKTELAFINLVDPAQSDQVVSELNKQYQDSISAVTQQTLLDSVFKEAVALLLLPFSILGILFISVTLIIIFSVCLINVRKESSTYGIYKSIGMTSGRIRWSITSGILILSAFGALFGVLVGVKLLPLLLEKVLVQYGLIKLPLVMNWGMAIGVACISILAACLGCWLSTRVIAKASPRILIVE